MKKIISVMGLSLALLFSSTLQADTKIAIVDIGAVMQQMPQKDELMKTLDNEFKSRGKGLEQEEKKAKEAAGKLQKDGMTLSDSEKTKLTNIIKSFQDKASAFSTDYRKRENEEGNKLLVIIEKAVNKIAKEQKYDLILNAEAAFYAVDSIDITNQVLEQVKK